MILLDSKTMQEMDRITIEELGVPGLILMENAGIGCFNVMEKEFPLEVKKGVLIVCGPGNNGGDGFVIARQLYQRGYKVRLVSLALLEKFKSDARVNLTACRGLGVDIKECTTEESVRRNMSQFLKDCGLVVDAIFGTGLSRDVKGHFATAIEIMNSAGKPILAVDIASGLSSDTGAVLGTAVKANLTCTMAFGKVGHFNWPGVLYTGKLHIINIGIPERLKEQFDITISCFTQEDLKSIFHKRPLDGHKGTFGHVLIVGGSRGKTGAACLCAQGALRAGAGLVTVASPRSSQFVLAQKLTEAMTEGIAETPEGQPAPEAFDQLMSLVEGKKAICIGPGFGTSESALTVSQKMAVYCPVPMVMDADSLTALKGCIEILKEAVAPRILTPHPGEMARMLECTTKEVQDNRIGVARRVAMETGATVVLKGMATVVASPEGLVTLNTTGNPGMGTGGMGDTLTGIIGALLAQGYSSWDAARIGVYVHGLSADYAKRTKGTYGYTATEAAEFLPRIWQGLEIGC